MSLREEFRELYPVGQTRGGLVKRTIAYCGFWWDDRQRRRQMPRLGQVLLAEGRVSERQLQEALIAQRRTGMRLGELLLTSGIISRSDLSSALRRQDKVSAAFTALMLSLAHTTAADAESVHAERLRASAQNSAENQQSASAADEALAEAQSVFGRKGPPANHVTLRGNEPSPELSGLVEGLPIHDRFKPRLAKVLPYVHKASAEFDVPAELILAIIHTESGFRENATTSWKAIGLMQVVALSGGAEAVRYIEGRKGYPSRSVLLEPESNIRLGTAYLRSLEDRHFSFIKNAEIRRAAVIAAYNQGPTKIRRMLRKHGLPRSVAGMHSLLRKYSVKQTRDYLDRVSRRSSMYRPVVQIRVADVR